MTSTLDDVDRVLTRSARSALRSWAFWALAAIVAIVIALLSLAAVGSGGQGEPLDPTNPAPAGAMAVAEVLRAQGVDVRVVHSLIEAREAVDDPAETTVLLHDPLRYLDDGQLREAVGLAGSVILLDPAFGQLQAVASSVAQAGEADGRFEAGCDLAAAARAGSISGAASGYRILDDADATGCFAQGDDAYALVALGDGLVVLGATAALSNEFVIQDGNAALVLGLLGAHERLVWYLPGIADLDEAPVTIGDLTPPWVTPVLVLLVLVFIAAAIWRGRRFGPLVIENLPVTVKASETMLGRARLYERSSARLRALDALRVGSIQRLAAACGLPRTATVDDVVTAVAELTSMHPSEVRRLLVDADPRSDADLVALSDALLTLERDVARASRP